MTTQKLLDRLNNVMIEYSDTFSSQKYLTKKKRHVFIH